MGNAEFCQEGPHSKDSRDGTFQAGEWSMNCVICGCKVEEANHIAITTEGDPVIMCDNCYKKVEPFFKEVFYDVQEDS